MTHTKQPHLAVGQIIPAFSLPGADGMPHSPWNDKQNQNLILLFTHTTSSSEACGLLDTFAKAYSSFREEQCSILAISPDTVFANLHTQEELRLPYPLLSDPKGEIISKYIHWDATTHSFNSSFVLADRYNAFYQQWVARTEGELPSIEKLLTSLRYLNTLCTP